VVSKSYQPSVCLALSFCSIRLTSPSIIRLSFISSTAAYDLLPILSGCEKAFLVGGWSPILWLYIYLAPFHGIYLGVWSSIFFFLFFLVCNSFISFGCNLTSTIQGSGPLGHLFLPLHVAWLFPELFVLSLWKQKFSGVFILESHEFFQYVRWCEESSSYLVLLGEGFFHFILSLFYH